MKKTIYALIVVVIIIVIGVGIYFVTRSSPSVPAQNLPQIPPLATSTQVQNPAPIATSTVIGKSVDGKDITAYYFGTGSTEITFVGGIHGGYEWNTALLAYQLIDYLTQNPSVIPANIRVAVIPVLNPDGLSKVVSTTGVNGSFSAADVTTSQTTLVAGRFNANNVDLNRNFDCDWQASGVWQNKTVSGGTSAFSEPESQAMQNYVETNKPAAVVIWYSSAGGVYASNCHAAVSAATNALTQTYATGSGYPAFESYDFYATTGDMANWLAKNNIPAISVLLTNHADTEWTKNLAGIEAVLKSYSK